MNQYSSRFSLNQYRLERKKFLWWRSWS